MKQGYREDKNLASIVNEDTAEYERRNAQDEARLKEAITRTPTEKFRFLMTLMKMNNQMRKATIHYK